jgi:hypothetical protein
MGWRTKFVFLLIVYCAGFATAIYYLAPTPAGKLSQHLALSQMTSAVHPDRLLASLRSGMDKYLGLSKEAAEQAAKVLQTKLDEATKSPAKE